MPRLLPLLVCLLAATPGAAQPRYALPPPLPLDPGDADPMTTARLHPIGWSASGKLAYVYARPTQASDDADWRLRVQDLQTDRLLVDQPLGPDRYGWVELPEAWAHSQALLDSLLAAHAIVPADSFVLRPFPARLGPFYSLVLETELTTVPGTDPDLGYDGIETLDLFLVQNRTARKRIHHDHLVRYLPLGVGVLGFLESPHEPRIAVLLGRVERGWEGPPHVLDVEVVGAGVGAAF